MVSPTLLLYPSTHHLIVSPRPRQKTRSLRERIHDCISIILRTTFTDLSDKVTVDLSDKSTISTRLMSEASIYGTFVHVDPECSATRSTELDQSGDLR